MEYTWRGLINFHSRKKNTQSILFIPPCHSYSSKFTNAHQGSIGSQNNELQPHSYNYLPSVLPPKSLTAKPENRSSAGLFCDRTHPNVRSDLSCEAYNVATLINDKWDIIGPTIPQNGL